MTRIDSELVSNVQYNCDVSDARFAGHYTLCIYLLKMREYYRWRHGLPLRESLAMPRVSDWVHRTEDRWESLETRTFEPVALGGERFDVFDDDGINRQLAGSGVVYSSGIGRFGKPVMFLAECLDSRSSDGLTVVVAGREYARELAAPPAMIRGRRIYLRRQSIERMLFEAVEEWRWHRREGPMQKVHEHYGFDRDPDAALAALVDDQVDQLLLHERGEFEAGCRLEGDWDAMLADVASTRAESVARAVRDCLADCLVVLPRLVDTGRSELVHFHVAMLTPVARELFPALPQAYRRWVDGASLGSLSSLADEAARHFLRVGNRMLARHQAGRPVIDAGHDDLQRLAFAHS